MNYKRYLDPTTDVTFKKIFGDKNKKDIIIAFLNEVLERKEGSKIIDVTHIDPHNLPCTLYDKRSAVDVKCVDEKKTTYIIEMQVINEAYFLDRCQYYASVEVSRQLDLTHRYDKLTPVIFVGIANFNLFEDTREYASHHVLMNTKNKKHYLKLIEYHFLELPKFRKKIHQLKSVIDQWMYFLKNAERIFDIPAILQSNEPIMNAFTVLQNINYSKAELAAYEKQADADRLHYGSLDFAINRGRTEGRSEGRIEALFEIVQKGIQAGFPLELISKITGLSIEELQKIEISYSS